MFTSPIDQKHCSTLALQELTRYLSLRGDPRFREFVSYLTSYPHWGDRSPRYLIRRRLEQNLADSSARRRWVGLARAEVQGDSTNRRAGGADLACEGVPGIAEIDKRDILFTRLLQTSDLKAVRGEIYFGGALYSDALFDPFPRIFRTFISDR